MTAQSLTREATANLAGNARELAANLPELLTDARRVAATVAHGVHGRKRAGPGETFWQFRSFEHGDSSALVDWRRSAGSSHLFVREREWEAAHTVWIWVDLSPSMHFRSHLAQHTKAERACLLAFALASLLIEGGERVGLLGRMGPRGGSGAISAMLDAFADATGDFHGLPGDDIRLSRHAELVMFGDFLEPEDDIDRCFNGFANQGVRGHAVQILDPAEESLPYRGRVEFSDADAGVRYTAERAEALRDAYAERMSSHRAAIGLSAGALGWTPFLHHTDRPAVEVLLSLHMHLSGLDKSYRSAQAAADFSPKSITS